MVITAGVESWQVTQARGSITVGDWDLGTVSCQYPDIREKEIIVNTGCISIPVSIAGIIFTAVYHPLGRILNTV